MVITLEFQENNLSGLILILEELNEETFSANAKKKLRADYKNT